MGPGRFVVFEGGDGAGKGSVLESLRDDLLAAGYDVVCTREPGGTPEGLALRELLLSEAGAVWDQHAELLLMVAARIQHVRRVIRPALVQGRVVLCDRYVGSTLAYQGGGRGLDQAMILRLHRELVDDVWPDVTILLDVNPAIGLSRSKARLAADLGVDEGRFEGLDLAFHTRVRDAYRALASVLPGWVSIDAEAPLAEVQAAVRAVVMPRMMPVSRARGGCG